jgi:dTDP-4-dehydrorhamnose reductase
MNKKRILVIGGSSKIGLTLVNMIKKRFSSNFEVFATYNTQKIPYFEQLDITDSVMIGNLFSKIKPDVVILTAALIYPIKWKKIKNLLEN